MRLYMCHLELHQFCIFSNLIFSVLSLYCWRLKGTSVPESYWRKKLHRRGLFHLKEMRRFWFAIGLIDFLLPLVNFAASLFLVKGARK